MFPLCHKAVQQYFFFFTESLLKGSHKSLLIILNFIFVIKSANSGAAESRRTAINLSSKNNTEVCSCLTYAAFI